MSKIRVSVSIEKSLLQKADQLALQMKLSRSQLFTMGVEELIHRQENIALLEQINKAYSELLDEDYDLPSPAAIRRQMRRLIGNERY